MNKATVTDNKNTHLTLPGKTISNHHFNKMAYRYFVAVIPIATLLLISTSYQESTDDENSMARVHCAPATVDSLRSALSTELSYSLVNIADENPVMLQYIRKFYFNNGYKPVWTHYKGVNAQGIKFLELIEQAREYGLEPQHYHFSSLRKLRSKLEEATQSTQQPTTGVDLEILMTDAALRFMVNLHTGYCSFDSTLFNSTWVEDLPGILLQGFQKAKVTESILSIQPQFAEYINLQKASKRFIKSNDLTDECMEINYPTKDSATLYTQIRKALKKSGYLDKNARELNLSMALKEFQYYHGLMPDGKPGKNTIEALKQSSMFRYKVLALNLDRLRKSQDLNTNLLYVNIPAYTMKVYEGNKLMDTFRVIVGNPATPTPTLSARMERVIANPTWFVPKSITMNEILPKMMADSGYLQRNGFKVLDKNYKTVDYKVMDLSTATASNFEYTLRQDRGSDNSLGQVKFIFSSPYAIYLHDTPGKKMFSKDIRAFSHGCVRVQNPERLAGYILNECNGDTTNFARLMETGRHREFDIKSELSIQIMYITCEADNAGRLFFYKDIYGNDKKELEKLSAQIGI